ncbi:DEAD/DEAH box helicase [Clostridium rectalis]|uniref:DEAD/DEAH box helicase n=1 Tax=Clostridium rectalis TaxID=2040295 RepID=UPI000F63F34C|nr:DEAD/DEAH box helicase [Clostridium rectalis]
MSKLNFEHFKLSNEILKSLKGLGYINPSKVQEEVIPFVLENKDVIVKSQTGSGKTAAFGIPVCEKIDVEEKKPQVLILTPTRELAVQIKEDIFKIGRFKKIRCAAVFGKQPMNLQKSELKQRVHIVVGTPGRTFDHIKRGNLDLEKIKYFILDEADEMLNMGFIDQVKDIINALPKNRVTMLFSATMPEEIERLCKKYMVNPSKIEIHPENVTTDTIEEMYYEVEKDSKFQLLKKIIYTESPNSCILFCNTKDAVDTLLNNMKKSKFSCEAIHGGMDQRDRLETMKRFKEGEFQFLVATDVAARGIHIENITHVINYEVPMEKESYVHRIGRTGRAGNEGKAITFAYNYELKFLKNIKEYIGHDMVKKDTPSEIQVQEGKKDFEYKLKHKVKPKLKNNKLDNEITKIYISAGKKKKIRPGDIVGAISNIDGVYAEDIGIIDVNDTHSYVDILNGKGNLVIRSLHKKNIKGKEVRVQKAVK